MADHDPADDFLDMTPHAGESADLDRRAKIIVVGYTLLTAHGLDGVTVRAVLAGTGFNRRVFYQHFTGRDDLLLAIFQRSLNLLATRCRAQMAQLNDPLQRLSFIVRYIALGDRLHPQRRAQSTRRAAALCREHIRLAETRPDALAAALHPVIALFAEQLADGMRTGQVRHHPPERLAKLIYTLVSTTIHAELLALEGGHGLSGDREQLADELWEFCLRAVST